MRKTGIILRHASNRFRVIIVEIKWGKFSGDISLVGRCEPHPPHQFTSKLLIDKPLSHPYGQEKGAKTTSNLRLPSH